jgi:hypothetical protein
MSFLKWSNSLLSLSDAIHNVSANAFVAIDLDASNTLNLELAGLSYDFHDQ